MPVRVPGVVVVVKRVVAGRYEIEMLLRVEAIALGAGHISGGGSFGRFEHLLED